jgi:hypothetical protein
MYPRARRQPHPLYSGTMSIRANGQLCQRLASGHQMPQLWHILCSTRVCRSRLPPPDGSISAYLAPANKGRRFFKRLELSRFTTAWDGAQPGTAPAR